MEAVKVGEDGGDTTTVRSGRSVIDDSAVLELASNRSIDLCLSRFKDIQNKNNRSFGTGCYNRATTTMMTLSVK